MSKKLVEQNAYHIKIINSELGVLGDEQKKTNGYIQTMKHEFSKEIMNLKSEIREMKTNFSWILKIGGALISIVIPALTALLIKLIL